MNEFLEEYQETLQAESLVEGLLKPILELVETLDKFMVEII